MILENQHGDMNIHIGMI